LLFWFSFVVFCPILLWALFDSRKRCLHDILAGVLFINRPNCRIILTFAAGRQGRFSPLLADCVERL
jgi:hypothetical protein